MPLVQALDFSPGNVSQFTFDNTNWNHTSLYPAPYNHNTSGYGRAVQPLTRRNGTYACRIEVRQDDVYDPVNNPGGENQALVYNWQTGAAGQSASGLDAWLQSAIYIDPSTAIQNSWFIPLEIHQRNLAAGPAPFNLDFSGGTVKLIVRGHPGPFSGNPFYQTIFDLTVPTNSVASSWTPGFSLASKVLATIPYVTGKWYPLSVGFKFDGTLPGSGGVGTIEAWLGDVQILASSNVPTWYNGAALAVYIDLYRRGFGSNNNTAVVVHADAGFYSGTSRPTHTPNVNDVQPNGVGGGTGGGDNTTIPTVTVGKDRYPASPVVGAGRAGLAPSNFQTGCEITFAFGCAVDGLWVWLGDNGVAGSQTVTPGIYDTTGATGNPGRKLAVGPGITKTHPFTGDWNLSSLSSPVNIPAGDYWFVITYGATAGVATIGTTVSAGGGRYCAGSGSLVDPAPVMGTSDFVFACAVDGVRFTASPPQNPSGPNPTGIRLLTKARTVRVGGHIVGGTKRGTGGF